MLLWTIITGLVLISSSAANKNINKYGRQTLLDLRPPTDISTPASLLDKLKRLEEALNSRDALQNDVFMKKKPIRKRGRRGGVRAKLRRRGIRTPLLTLTFDNVRSISNKVDEFAANCKFIMDYRESGFIAKMESWLQEKDDDGTVNIDEFSLVRGDKKEVVKQRGGGVTVYVNDRWCTQVNVKERLCSDNVKYLVISYRPFYLSREFNNVIITTVYIPPGADAKIASDILLNCVSKYEN